MNRSLLLIIALTTSSILYSQSYIENRCPYKILPLTGSRIIKSADDFTITTTDGITRNLYNTLDSGKTVFVDLFYTTCYWCQFYSPVIEEIYQNTGAGQGEIVFWGISNDPDDSNTVIDQYKINHNVSNPCAGPQGGGTTAHNIVISGQNFYGWPTYCVICPDRTLFFDPCYPPTVTGFDPYFEECAGTIGINDHNLSTGRSGIVSVYPDPVSNEIKLEVTLKESGHVIIELYNLLGSTVFSITFECLQGKQNLIIPGGHLPSGIYVISLKQKNQFTDSCKVLISGR